MAAWLTDRCKDGLVPDEIGIFVRSEAELNRAHTCVFKAGLSSDEIENPMDSADSRVFIGTMHLAKGLEFRAVSVMTCNDEVIPLQS